MMKFKKGIAIVLAATMVMGSSIVAFAADPVTEGGSTGAGTSEGHVNKHIINVVLPTIAEGATPFAYTVDPERLVSETSAARYSSTTFTDNAKGNGVYFLVEANKYDSTSAAQKVTSKSSADIKLTVDVEVTAAPSGMTIVDTAPDVTGTVDTTASPELYLALTVGDKTPVAVKADEKISVETTIAGTDSNFETTYADGAYKYTEKSGTLTWQDADITLSGVCSKASAEDITAPTLKVTWKYEDPAAAPTTYTVTYKANDGADPATADKTETVNVGSNPTGPETAFTREGYTFQGWSETADGEAVELNTITEAKTLYAIWTEDAAAPSIATTEYTYTSGQALEIPVDLGVGSKAATGLSITHLKKDGVTIKTLAAGTEYTFANSKISFTSDQITTLMGVDTRILTVTFNDTDETAVQVTITK